jgi:serine/threonine protein kinase
LGYRKLLGSEAGVTDESCDYAAVFLDDSRENVKLGDFGLSKSMGAAAFANTYVGTPYYMSPELFSESAYDSKSDIWALGCVIYEMVALQ